MMLEEGNSVLSVRMEVIELKQAVVSAILNVGHAEEVKNMNVLPALMDTML